VAETREHEALNRAERRQAEEALAQLAARRHALEELERDRVGLAPAAASLLAARDRSTAGFGPLSDSSAPAGRTPSWRNASWVTGCTRCSCGTAPPSARCGSGTASSSRGRWCCSRSIPVRSRWATGSRWTTGCTPRGPRRPGSAPPSPDRRCWTPRGGSCGAPAGPSSCRVPALPRVRSAAGPSWPT
jgi:hypothetical protein